MIASSSCEIWTRTMYNKKIDNLVPSQPLRQKNNSSQMSYVIWQVRALITALPSGIKIYESMKYFLILCLRVEPTAERSPISSLLSNTLEIAEQRVYCSITLPLCYICYLIPCLNFVPLNKNCSGIQCEITFPRSAQQNSVGFSSNGILPFALTKLMNAC